MPLTSLNVVSLQDGRVLYATTTYTPSEILSAFRGVIETGRVSAEAREDKMVCVGTWEVCKRTVTVEVNMPHAANHFELEIADRGNRTMRFMRHKSSVSTYNGEKVETELKVPNVDDHKFVYRRR